MLKKLYFEAHLFMAKVVNKALFWIVMLGGLLMPYWAFTHQRITLSVVIVLVIDVVYFSTHVGDYKNNARYASIN